MSNSSRCTTKMPTLFLLVYNSLQSSSLEHIPFYFKNGKQLCQNALFVLVATHSDERNFSEEAGEQQAKELGIPSHICKNGREIISTLRDVSLARILVSGKQVNPSFPSQPKGFRPTVVLQANRLPQ